MIPMLPNWQSKLMKSLESCRHQPESRYFQLATVTADAKPNVRTVVFRGFDDTSDTLYVVTDTRTQKIAELRHSPHVCVSWYFSRTREQYRIYSQAVIHEMQNNDALVQLHWQKMSDAGKRQFLWGEPRSPLGDTRELRIESIPTQAPEHFCVLSLRIDSLDYLTLRGNPQHRELHYKDDKGEWQVRAVTP